MRKLIGLHGNLDAVNKVAKHIQALGAGVQIENVREASVSDLTPKGSFDIFGDTHVRQVASKLGIMIPVSLASGKATPGRYDIVNYTEELANKYAPKGWAATYFLNNSFYFKKEGVFTSAITNADDIEPLQNALNKDFVLVSVFESENEIPEVFSGLSIVIGPSKLKEKTIKLLESIKQTYFNK